MFISKHCDIKTAANKDGTVELLFYQNPQAEREKNAFYIQANNPKILANMQLAQAQAQALSFYGQEMVAQPLLQQPLTARVVFSLVSIDNEGRETPVPEEYYLTSKIWSDKNRIFVYVTAVTYNTHVERLMFGYNLESEMGVFDALMLSMTQKSDVRLAGAGVDKDCKVLMKAVIHTSFATEERYVHSLTTQTEIRKSFPNDLCE